MTTISQCSSWRWSGHEYLRTRPFEYEVPIHGPYRNQTARVHSLKNEKQDNIVGKKDTINNIKQYQRVTVESLTKTYRNDDKD